MSERARDAGGMSDGAPVRPWRPPSLVRSAGDAAEAAGGSGGLGAALLGPDVAGARGRRWHENDDVAGLTALLGNRRPVRPTGEEAWTPESDATAPGSEAPVGVRGAEGGDADEASEATGAMRSEAFDAGFAAGAAAAREAATAESSGGEHADALAELARAFARETTIEIDALEGELVALARSMAACALRRELLADPAFFAERVREALEPLEAIGGEAPVTVRLHPTDAELLDGRLGPDVRIVPDASLARSDCRLERGPARIDAGVHARLDALGLDVGPGLGADVDVGTGTGTDGP